MRTLAYLLFSGAAHLLAARWVLSAFPGARRRRRLVLALAGVLSFVVPVLKILESRGHDAVYQRAIAVALIELATVALALVPIGLVAVLSRAAVRALAWARPASTAGEEHARLSRRQAIEAGAGIAIAGASGAALGWGIVRGRHAFVVEEVVVRVPGWPRVLDGYVVAQVSDIHVGALVHDRELDEGFEVVRSVRPDLVVATGDLVDIEAEAIGPLLARLLATNARDGAFAILGNHDHYAGAAEVAALVRGSKVRLLDNEAVNLRPGDGGGFALVGVDDLRGRGRRRATTFRGPDLGRALTGLAPDLPRILLAHQPTYFREAQGRVALQLSGHTHGGQINPGFRPAAALMDFVAGRYERGGSTLWVNRGFGVVGPPARLGAPPEVTKVVIVAA